jgi:hypothetical protein
MSRGSTAALLALALLACESPPTGSLPLPAVPPAPSASAPSEAAATSAAAGNPPADADAEPGPAPLTRATAQAGEALQALERAGESQVDPAARFLVEVAVPLADARLSLFDAQEALVPCESTAEVASTATRISLAPAKPLRPGSRYTLRLEGASVKELHDLGGKAYLPVSLALQAAGEPPAEPEKKAKGKGKRRKRR